MPLYLDADGDTYGDPASTKLGCGPLGAYVTDATDCKDDAATVHPGAVEVCDGVNNNCADGADDGAGTVTFADADNDGFGDPSTSQQSCTPPSGYVADDGDCDDDDPAVHPGATELCDFVDGDCDAQTTDDGTVSFDDGTGPVDVTGDFAIGTVDSPVAWTSAVDGTLRLCEGTFYTRLALTSNVTVLGAGVGLTVIDAGGTGPGVVTSGVDAELADFTITGGVGVYDPNAADPSAAACSATAGPSASIGSS